ncbi:MAG TPA: AAA family ATPase [Terriglobales bacterium]
MTERTVTPSTDRFFVVTGGPGSGKSTLLDALERLGYNRSFEAGRAIIQDQTAIGGTALPWADRGAFAELMLTWEVRSYHLAAQSSGPFFFDRSVVDLLGYLELSGLAVPKHIEEAAKIFRYHRRVFIAPPWEEIYTKDVERKQDFEEAVRTCHAMHSAYLTHGYELIELPRASVETRVDFVLASSGLKPR